MARKVIIVEDDDIAGDLSRALLQDAGFEVKLLTESRRALDAIREFHPDLIVLDILMPGIDGLSLCRRIKSDPDMNAVKIAVVSAKSFSADKAKAKESGADIFISKPYDVETFAAQIGALLVPKKDDALQGGREPLTDSPNPVFHATIWGNRSRAATEAEPSRYGRKTPCVGVEAAERLILFDAGTGIIAAGREIETADRHKEVWIFLSHFHPAHVEGLAELSFLARPDFTVHFCAAPETDKSLADLMRPLLESRTSPAGKVRAKMDLYEIRGERYEIFPGVIMTPFYTNHPGETLGFVLESGGRTMAYCPDDGIYGARAQALQDHDEKISRLYSGAELVIHDGRYTPEDRLSFEDDGHSSFQDTAALAGGCGAKRLILFHQDARYSDSDIDRMVSEASKLAKDAGRSIQIAAAQEGLRVAV